MGNFQTKATVTYTNIRVMADVKHLAAKGEKDSVTFVPFIHSSKGNDSIDLWGDLHIKFRAEDAANLKKGDYLFVTGRQAFKTDKKGNVRMTVYVEDYQLLGDLKARAAASGGADAAADEAADEDTGSAFD